LIISHRLKGTIEDCFAYLEQMGDISQKHEWQLSDYQDNINMIRGCIKVLQWFTTDNYEADTCRGKQVLAEYRGDVLMSVCLNEENAVVR
jgi:hypothetical protein